MFISIFFINFKSERKTVSLKPGAVPRIFKGLPTCLSAPTPESRGSPSKRRRKMIAREETLHLAWVESDTISTYQKLTRLIRERLDKSFPAVRSVDCLDHVLLYKLEHSEDKDRSVAVAVTIILLDDMTVSMFIRDGRLPNSEPNWAWSHTGGKLQLWSQLDNILARYVIGKVASINYLSRSKMIASTLEELECTTEKQRHTISFLAEHLKLAFALPKGRRYSLDMLICAFTLYHNFISHQRATCRFSNCYASQMSVC